MLEKPIQIRNNIFNKKLDIESEQTNPTTIKSKSQSSNVLNEKKEAFKTLFSNKDYLVNYLRKNYPSFGEEFELTNFISTGGTGVVYAGQLKKRKNAQKLAIKFKYSKRQNRDKDEFQEIGIALLCFRFRKAWRPRKIHENPSKKESIIGNDLMLFCKTNP